MSVREGASPTGAVEARSNRVLLLTVLVAGHAMKHIFNAGFFIILPELKTGLGLTNAGVGTLSTVRNVAGGVANLPAGFLADRYSRRFASILAVSMILIGVFYFLLGRVDSYGQALLAATLAVVVLTAWHPSAIGALSRVFAARRGFAIALHGTGASIGEALSPILVGSLLAVLAWRTVLQGSLAPAVVTGTLIWVLLRSFRVESKPVTVRAYLRSFGGLFRNKKLLIIFLITGGYAAAQSAMMTFLPLYIREDLGRSTLVLGGYLSLAQVVGIGSQPLMGHLADRLGRKAVIFPSLLGMGLSLLGLYLLPTGVPFIVMLAVMGAFIFTLMAMMLTAAADVVTTDIHGATVSLVYSSWIVFAGISPLLAGLIADDVGIRYVFLYASGIALATSLFALVTPWQRR